jgi:exopolysaccharide biosynthesis polyprenyl glycosylphosphotransferase
MRRTRAAITYALGDALVSLIVWLMVLWMENGWPLFVAYWHCASVVAVPFFWLLLYGLISTYQKVYGKSRTKELTDSLWGSLAGVALMAGIVYSADLATGHFSASSWFTYAGLQAGFLGFWRLMYLTRLKHQIKIRKIGFPTLMVGSNDKAVDLYKELEASRGSQGYDFVGFLNIENNSPTKLAPFMPNLGYYYDLPQVIKSQGIEEVIIALESSEHDRIQKLMALLADQQVAVKVLPDMYDFITGTVKMNYLFGTALIEVNPWFMPAWQQNLKRLMDLSFSVLVLILASPLFFIIIAGIKLTSKGPVIFQQERRGLHDQPFNMYKFRTMCNNAEAQGPQLSSEDDPRVTRFGRFLRQYRLDELPQFLNVIKGDMSLVGPRPEREYFIKQIMEIAPNYKHLLRVKPGITSWGQVKFGYAENVNEMIARMKYDLLYIENMSLSMDLKILFYTVYIIFQGRGK